MTAKKPVNSKKANKSRPAPPPPAPATVNDVLMAVQAEQPGNAVVIYEKGGRIMVKASHMSSAQALWFVKEAELLALNIARNN